ncbi:sigma-70 family RNA polymerase sigma factor [Pseudoroseicyclus aestuarii]|uniref:RNA polymerase sigma-70 factor (ECF subfamily) n=1 Tax=Pseudoroseicyclus aestuarii TaxID=1795041 RepID=A0A318SPH9_9RHOB|nr:sigma-70 family RNA polymerase sigma factor [Pseudoroseicyclus aestuarii]PYE82505.1 RNA polymerase sigma-70 factor (ECF subfamily) [Pseudoroseicyclus aestuarii]
MTDRDELERIIARVALQDRKAFGQLYERTQAKLFGICLRILRSRAEAEDALQEVYVRVWHNADRYQVLGLSPMTWLITIARNHAIDLLRRRRVAERSGQAPIAEAMEQPDASPGPEALTLARSDGDLLRACLGELEPERSEAVQGAYMFGFTYAELADRYAVPLNTMRTWLRRSLQRLKECMSR